MNEKAIYTVHQHGKDAQFYSYCAGGYSYPFHVADWLSRLDADLNHDVVEGEELSVAPLLPQLKGDYFFPEAAKGLQLFRSISDSEAAAHLGRTAVNERIPFHITLDLEQGTVGFVFNRDCPELDLPDVEVPMRGNHDEFSGLVLDEFADLERFEHARTNPSPFVAEVNESVYEQLIRSYADQQLRQEPGGMGIQMG